MKIIIFNIILLFSILSISFAQTTQTNRAFWLSVEENFINSKNESFVSISGEINYSYSNRTLLKLNFGYADGFLNSCHFNELNAQYGCFVFEKKHFSISGSGGMGVIWGTINGALIRTGFLSDYYEEEEFVTVGLPLDLTISLIPFKYFGIYATGSVNFNSKHPYWGLGVGISIGKLRKNQSK